MDRLSVTLPTIQSELALAVLAAARAETRRRRSIRRAQAQVLDTVGNTTVGAVGARIARVKVVLTLINFGEISTEELLVSEWLQV
jgi:hypothetical protein